MYTIGREEGKGTFEGVQGIAKHKPNNSMLVSIEDHGVV
jgi:hypothetical protein